MTLGVAGETWRLVRNKFGISPSICLAIHPCTHFTDGGNELWRLRVVSKQPEVTEAAGGGAENSPVLSHPHHPLPLPLEEQVAGKREGVAMDIGG